jgi:hypothetical protein
MLGFPLIPCTKIDHNPSACFLSYHALQDGRINKKIQTMIDNDIPLLMTDGIAEKLEGVDVQKPNIYILECRGNPYSLLDIPGQTLKEIREIVLRPFNISLEVKSRVALYLIGENTIVLENFNNEPVDVRLSMPGIRKAGRRLILPDNGDMTLAMKQDSVEGVLPARTLVALYT